MGQNLQRTLDKKMFLTKSEQVEVGLPGHGSHRKLKKKKPELLHFLYFLPLVFLSAASDCV